MSEFKDRQGWYMMRYRYGIEPIEFFELLVKQDSRCAICLVEFDFTERKQRYTQCCVDHEHISGQVRGLLCRSCNLAIGHFHDSTLWVQRALEYLGDTEMELSQRKRSDSQVKQVLNYMKKRGSITQATASHVFGCSRLASVIHRLKKKGHTIEAHYEQGIRGRFARYRLTPDK